MSSTTLKTQIPASISERLKKLRAAIKRFLLVEGLSKILAALVLMVLVDLGLDRMFKMDLAQRGIMLVVMAAILLTMLYRWILRPLSRKISDDALILQVEDKHRELQESVISAAQFSRGRDFEAQGYSQSMVDATIRHGSQMAEKIQFGKTINTAAFLRHLCLLILGICTLAAMGYGVASTEFWRTWFHRNILLSNDQWPRQTSLLIDGTTDQGLTLLRGEDHKQVVRVDGASRQPDVEVTIEFDDGTGRTKQKMRRTGELEHTLVFRNLNNPFRFRGLGGDHVTEWVDVQLVDPPNWSSVDLTVTMPEYTNVGPYELPPGGGPHTVLEGSTLNLQGSANKTLLAAGLKAGDQQWALQRQAAGQWDLVIPPQELAGGKYTFDLQDEMGLRSSRPTTFTLKLKPDRPPAVRGSLLGISGLVVPRARIPISYTAGDEFAVTKMWLEHVWTGDAAAQGTREGTQELTQLDPELASQLNQSEIKSVAVVDIEPLQLPVDVSLRLTLLAQDNNTLTGPGTGRSREFLLRVVSEEELRADLLRREIEQRKAFELIISNQEKLIFDLQAISDATSVGDSSMSPEQVLDQLRDVQRRQKLVGTNVSRVADRFQEFLVEAVNNRLDEAENEIEQSQSIEERFNERIIQPLRELDSQQIVRAGQQIELAGRHVVYDPATQVKKIEVAALQAGIRTSIAQQNTIVQKMQDILASMMDSETYQEIVNKVIEIKRTEERIREKARQKREQIGSEDIFDKQPEDGDLFDKDDPDDPAPAGAADDR